MLVSIKCLLLTDSDLLLLLDLPLLTGKSPDGATPQHHPPSGVFASFKSPHACIATCTYHAVPPLALSSCSCLCDSTLRRGNAASLAYTVLQWRVQTVWPTPTRSGLSWLGVLAADPGAHRTAHGTRHMPCRVSPAGHSCTSCIHYCASIHSCRAACGGASKLVGLPTVAAIACSGMGTACDFTANVPIAADRARPAHGMVTHHAQQLDQAWCSVWGFD